MKRFLILVVTGFVLSLCSCTVPSYVRTNIYGTVLDINDSNTATIPVIEAKGKAADIIAEKIAQNI